MVKMLEMHVLPTIRHCCLEPCPTCLPTLGKVPTYLAESFVVVEMPTLEPPAETTK